MKKIALLTIALLSSLNVIDAATKDDHPCKQMAEGASGGSCAKMTYDITMVIAFMKLGLPEGIIAIYFPFIHDLAEYEVNKLRQEATTLSQQQALALVSTLNNGWYIHTAMITLGLGSYYLSSQPNFEAFAKHETGRKAMQTMLATYVVSQLAAAGIAYYARKLNLLSKRAENKKIAYYSDAL